MDSVLLDKITRTLLLRCWEWQVISTLFPPDIAPLSKSGCESLLESAAKHQHPHRQILFFLQGTGIAALNGLAYPVAPRTVIFIDAFEPHGEQVLSESLIYLRVNIRHRQFSTRVFQLENNIPTGASSGEHILLVTHESVPLETQWAELGARRELSTLLIRARLLASTELLVAAILDDSSPPALSSNTSIKRDTISAIAEHIRQTAGRGARIRTLAQASGYGVCHFTRLFKEYTGFSVHQYIDRCRIERVRQMTHDGHSKKQIAVALGFATPSAFSHWLRSAAVQSLLASENDWSSCL